MYYVNIFFIYSIMGHIIENVLYTINGGESGILYGYWTPVYGLGVLVIVLIYKWLLNHIKKEYLRSLLLFLFSAIILSLLELAGGLLIENIFNKVFWNYEHFKYNFGKYIALETAAIWGVFSLFIIYLIKKPFDWVIKHVPKWLTFTLLLLFVIDSILTLIIK